MPQSTIIPTKINKSSELYPKTRVPTSLTQVHHVKTNLTQVQNKEEHKITGAPFSVIPVCVLIGVIALVSSMAITGTGLSFLGPLDVIGKSALESKLEDTEWSRAEVDDGAYYALELDFSDDTIDYYFKSFFFTRYIGSFDYEVIDGNTIDVNGMKVDVTFEDDDTMTVTPAITSGDYYETWHRN